MQDYSKRTVNRNRVYADKEADAQARKDTARRVLESVGLTREWLIAIRNRVEVSVKPFRTWDEIVADARRQRA